jgi:formiminotetrahydrofolate cyclodeaminase
MPNPGSPLDDWLAAIAAATPEYAGGSAAAVAGALGAALVEMVAGLTGRREKYAAVHAEAKDAVARAARLRDRLPALAVKDAEAFAGFTAALSMPKATADEQSARRAAQDQALRDGTAVQLELLEALAEVGELALALTERGLAGAAGDAATGALLAAAAGRSAGWAVRSNLAGATDAAARSDVERAKGLLERVESAERGVLALLEQRAG